MTPQDIGIVALWAVLIPLIVVFYAIWTVLFVEISYWIVRKLGWRGRYSAASQEVAK